MIRGILFDLGHTLLDFPPMQPRLVFRDGAARAYELIRPRLPAGMSLDRYCDQQYRILRRAYLWSRLINRELDSLALMRKSHEKLGVVLDLPTRLQMAWAWYQSLLAHASIAADVVPALRALRDRGLRLGLVSNTFVPPVTHDRHLEQAGLLEFFPVRVYSSEVRYRKPHRRIFQIALERLGTQASETLFVGDQIRTDILGARRVGMKTVLRLTSESKDHQNAADYVIRDISEVIGFTPVPTPVDRFR